MTIFYRTKKEIVDENKLKDPPRAKYPTGRRSNSICYMSILYFVRISRAYDYICNKVIDGKISKRLVRMSKDESR